MTRKGKLNWVKKHIAITTLQKWVFDKLRKYEKRFGSDVFGDMLISYMTEKIYTNGLDEKDEEFYKSLINEYEEKTKESV